MVEPTDSTEGSSLTNLENKHIEEKKDQGRTLTPVHGEKDFILKRKWNRVGTDSESKNVVKVSIPASEAVKGREHKRENPKSVASEPIDTNEADDVSEEQKEKKEKENA
ncbi:unnamed protein product [Hymenolepis diminuta]|uniref:Uncharacterized protein n=1 Tax=Hymenolepis diminuta TaxID=6216 RepID=A0A564Y2L9_HYMDI|nr:unnamed protein product [Hymenolepis diminuta]